MQKTTEKATNRFVVYADDRYYYSWIYPTAQRKIIDYLTSPDRQEYKFVVLNADELQDWMVSEIKNNEAAKTVVVFAQDMVPETIAPDYSPSIICRSYLDCGGKIVWMGDVPFFRQGKSCPNLPTWSKDEITKNQTEIWSEWNINGIFAILGLNCEFNQSPKEKTEVTKNGKKWGLLNNWYGTRPIAETDEKTVKLAESSANRYKPPELLSPDEKKSEFDDFANALNKVSISAGIFLGILTSILTLFYFILGSKIPLWVQPILLMGVFIFVFLLFVSLPRVSSLYKKYRPKKYPNAWIKNFNQNYPNSGFVRLWDTQVYDIEQSYLEDLLKVAIYGTDDKR